MARCRDMARWIDAEGRLEREAVTAAEWSGTRLASGTAAVGKGGQVGTATGRGSCALRGTMRCSAGRLTSVARVAKRAGTASAVLVLLTGCVTTQTQTSDLSIPEEDTRPTTVNARDLDAAALARVARVAENSGDIIDAAQVYRRMAERQPSAPEPRVELGRYLLRRGDVDAAEQAFQEALSLAPGNADAWTGSGQVLLARKQPKEAAAVFERVLASDPAHVRALNGAGLAHDEMRRHAQAQAFYRRALQASPDDPTVRNNLGLSLALSGRRDEAVAILRKLAGEPGALPRYRENLAFALSLRGSATARPSDEPL